MAYNSRRENRPDVWIKINLFVHAVTPKAVLVSKNSVSDIGGVWLPRSQCKFPRTPQRDTWLEIEAKDWVLKKNDLLEGDEEMDGHEDVVSRMTEDMSDDDWNARNGY